MATSKKAFDSEEYIRESYAIAEKMDLEGWKSRFTDGGIFVDNSVGITYEGSELDYPVRQYGAAFADMHRELYRIWIVDDTVIVRLALQGTHTGPLEMPFGTIRPTGKKMDAPCADIFELEGGKIKNSIAIPRARSF